MLTVPYERGKQLRYFTVATAGHVDHGKTSLLRRLTGIDPDRLKEEKERQMTTDLGFAHLSLPDDLEVGFIDVPGHGKFLKNMLAGVGGLDLALLVVAADEGPMPQTLQHVKILSLLGTRRAILAVAKKDLVDEGTLKTVQELSEELLREHRIEVAGSVAISSKEGSGFNELKSLLHDVCESLPERLPEGVAYLPIDRVFSKSGFGTVVTGTLVRGRLAEGEEVFIQPAGLTARIRRLETSGAEVENAGPGQRLAVNLAVKDSGKIARGCVVLDAGFQPVSSIVASIETAGKEIQKLKKSSGRVIRLYHGTAEVHGQLRWVESTGSGDDIAPLIAQIILDQPLVSGPGERYVVRLGDITIFGGSILFVNRPRWLVRSKMVEMSRCLLKGELKESLLYYLSACPQRAVDDEQLGRFLPDGEKELLLESLLCEGSIAKVSGYYLSRRKMTEIEESLVSTLSEGDGSSKTGVVAEAATGYQLSASGLEKLRFKVLPGVERDVFQKIVDGLLESGVVEKHGDRLSLAGTVSSDIAPELKDLSDRVDANLLNQNVIEIDKLAEGLNCSSKDVKAALEHLARQDRAYVVNYDFACSKKMIDQAHKVLDDIWKQGREISPSEFKSPLGISRKYAMALLAHFDDTKVTRRGSAGRVLLRPLG